MVRVKVTFPTEKNLVSFNDPNNSKCIIFKDYVFKKFQMYNLYEF